MTMKVPKPSKTNTKSLENKADRLFSKHITSLGQCQLQGKDTISCGGRLDPAHIVTRGIKNLRWDINGAICICRNHHAYYTAHPKEWETIIKRFFTGIWNYVQENKNVKFHENMQLVIADLESWT